MPAAIETTSGRLAAPARPVPQRTARTHLRLGRQHPGRGIPHGPRRRRPNTWTPKSCAQGIAQQQGPVRPRGCWRVAPARASPPTRLRAMLPPPMKARRVVHAVDSSCLDGRGPNRALPMRTMVAPSAIASAGSPRSCPSRGVSMPGWRSAGPANRRAIARNARAAACRIFMRRRDRHQPAAEAAVRRRRRRRAHRRPSAGSRACWHRRRG